ncbi:bifunctional glutamate N-acetyltransferase/amino-acid acetyltransferase ArgJ [Halovulum dunhuangense]|uniref:Arginine biosynthesis bifunctional protein ArgJ n=1 Tax=Halovulum dunhuangense TaxID=1505036 RepID=A0A849KZK7_9RHOB|nr:bifunctional glutamate N-acetyltransferase/amino-acid acetyltransferase ArgJ [Halovulum dunhuangense]NNU79234.1 bifunctional glutamate N-acetyltransferase/amino-acid acetyltransferase ArgJ [Halovulum dunhuangense]
MAKSLPVSPLAPAGGFPQMPAIAGVRFAAVEAGVRYKGRRDVMLAEIAAGSTIAGVFTRSATRSAPVLWCEENLAAGPQGEAGYAIVVNSGNANAFTGRNGMEAAQRTATAAAAALGIPERHVFLSSTGVIGEPLPAERITAKLDELVAHLSGDGIGDAAQAIMTTDTFPKGCARSVGIGGTTVQIAGIAKGSGMIAPDMATMLAYVFTDATVAQPVLQQMLRELTDVTFNAITVDSDTSTSDSLLLAATGRAGAPAIDRADSADATAFRAALHEVLLDLAQQLVRDGEGATKFVEVQVEGAVSDASAKRIGMSIANSPLIKTAIAGEDPNWGRIVMAIGKAGEPADRDRITIHFGDILVATDGWVAPGYREADGAAYMKRAELVIRVGLGLGEGKATVWTCDLTHGYISINADYRS